MAKRFLIGAGERTRTPDLRITNAHFCFSALFVKPRKTPYNTRFTVFPLRFKNLVFVYFRNFLRQICDKFATRETAGIALFMKHYKMRSERFTLKNGKLIA